MLISDLAREVHENAVAHGWWDEERKPPEIIALIHSEWSEALEEARAGRPQAYIIVDEKLINVCLNPRREKHDVIIWRRSDGRYTYNGREYHGKPEGVAVELIDGCIRILDYIGKLGVLKQDSSDLKLEMSALTDDADLIKEDLPDMVAHLHWVTSHALYAECDYTRSLYLILSMSAALSWVKKQGIDPLQLLLEKHEYNKTRPYKHGKRF